MCLIATKLVGVFLGTVGIDRTSKFQNQTPTYHIHMHNYHQTPLQIMIFILSSELSCLTKLNPLPNQSNIDYLDVNDFKHNKSCLGLSLLR